MTLAAVLAERAAAHPDRPAFTIEGQTSTFAELLAGARAAAGAMQARGIGPGDHVALVLGSTHDFLRAIFGVTLLGATPVAINPSLPPEAIARRLKLIRAALAVVEPGATHELGAPRLASPELLIGPVYRSAPFDSPDSGLAFLQLTSGTTGESKAAMITHGNLKAQLVASALTGEALESDVRVGWVPLYHDLGIVRFVFGPVWFGNHCHLIAPSLANLREWFLTITRTRATITASPDFGYRLAARMVDPAGIDLGSLRIANSGGEPVRASTIEAFEQRFGVSGVIRPGYGLAEATLAVTVVRRGEAHRVDATGQISSGTPFPNVRLRIVGADGSMCAPGESGAIEVGGAQVFAGYLDDAEATAEAITPDGWLRTGDTGALDADGFLYVHGRTRAMIKRAGALIAPRELEEAAERVAGVRLSAAVGIDREGLGGEDVVVVLEVKPEIAQNPAQRAALVAAVSTEIARAIGAAPAEVRLVPARSIPLTYNGKIRHAELRRLLLAHAL